MDGSESADRKGAGLDHGVGGPGQRLVVTARVSKGSDLPDPQVLSNHKHKLSLARNQDREESISLLRRTTYCMIPLI